MPIVLVPGLNCSARLYAEQIPVMWRFGPVTVADHRGQATIAAIAQAILADAPRRFALAGLSMGGYIAFEIMRQAPERVDRLALLSTAAQPEKPEQSRVREERIALARSGRYAAVHDAQWPTLVHESRQGEEGLAAVHRAMMEDVGAEAYVRQQRAIMGRADSRPTLAAIRCPTLVLVGDADQLTPPHHAEEIAAGIAGSRLVTVPACGHLSTLERPEAVNAALVRWMQERGSESFQ